MTTRARYRVVGAPVGHSLSPAMMNAAFAAAGIDERYEATEIRAEHWARDLAALAAAGVRGINVTVPHKERAYASAGERSATANTIGAANTLRRKGDGWFADNTDGPGLVDEWRRLGAESRAAAGALVLGAGGSARAALFALRELGFRAVSVAARSPARAAELVQAANFGAVAEAGAAAPVGGLVVNCTPLGLRPDDPPPLSAEATAPAGLVYDLVYPETPWVAAAREHGQTADDGLGLLVAQGARSFELWTGVEPDRAVMRAAAEAALARRRGFPS